MVKINEEKQFKVTQESLAKILSQYGIDDFEYEIFSEGIINASIKIISQNKKYVLRIYQFGNKPNDYILLELEFQDFLRNSGLPIPIIYKNNQDQELTCIKIEDKVWQVILMEFIEGTHSESYPDDLLIELAQIQAKMHLLGIEFAKKRNESRKGSKVWAPRYDLEIPTNYDSEVGDFMKRVKEFEFKDNSDLPHGYNHMDLDFHGNILIDNNHITAILDFDDLGYTPCIMCLGITVWDILSTTNSWDKVYFYLGEYQKVRKLDKEELNFLPLAILYRNYVIGVLDITLWKNDKEFGKTLELEKQIKNINFYE